MNEQEYLPTSTPFQAKLSREKYRVLIALAAILGASFSLCFWNLNNIPHLSLLLFSIVVLTTGYYAIKQLGYLVNPKGLFWAIPIMLLSAMNFIFAENAFTYFNVPVVFFLYLIYAFALVSNQTILVNFFSLFTRVCKAILPKIAIISFLIKETKASRKSNSRWANSPFKKVLIGVGAALPLLLILFALLLSADMVFEEIVGISSDTLANFLENFHLINLAWQIFLFVLATAYFIGFLYYLGLPLRQSTKGQSSLKLDPTIAFSFLGAINLLFLFFCVIQFAFLFQNSFFELPTGITYAEYVRSGFFQLLFVSCINFAVVFIFVYLLKSMERKLATKIMLFCLSCFTAVLILSSFYRMFMYTEEYGFTFLRMAVLTFLVMETVLVIATTVYLVRGGFNLFQCCCIIVCAFYVLVNLTASEAVVTRLNIVHYYETGETDPFYFSETISKNSLSQVEDFQADIELQRMDEETQYLNTKLKEGITRTNNQIKFDQSLRWQNLTVMQLLSD